MINLEIYKRKECFNKKELIEEINSLIKEQGDNLKELVINDWRNFLTQEDINRLDVKSTHVPAPSGMFLELVKKQNKGSFVVVYTYSEEEKELQKEKEAQKRDFIDRFNKAGIPQDYLYKGFSSIEAVKGFESSDSKIKEYLREFKSKKKEGIGLFMFGNTGAGKSMLISLLAKNLLKQGYSVKFYDTSDLFTQIKHSFQKESSLSEERILKELLGSDVFVLDDLGAEKPTEFVIEKLFYIINKRIVTKKPILITSNYSPENLVERLGDKPRILSRLLGSCIVIENGAEDYRLELSKKLSSSARHS